MKQNEIEIKKNNSYMLKWLFTGVTISKQQQMVKIRDYSFIFFLV